MAQYGNMTLREREDKNTKRRSLRTEEKSEEIEVLSSDTKKARPKKVEYYRGAKYDSQGCLIEDGSSPCDCMDKSCPGCFMECDNCSSTKCGHECRVNRKWIYEECNVEGTNVSFKASFKKF